MFWALFYPWKRAEIRPFWGRPTFFRTLAHAGWCVKKKPPNGIRLKKHQKFQKKHRLWDRTHEMVCVIITDFTYGTEEVFTWYVYIGGAGEAFRPLPKGVVCDPIETPTRGKMKSAAFSGGHMLSLESHKSDYSDYASSKPSYRYASYQTGVLI